MLNLSINELKQIAKMRLIKGYNNMSEESLLSVLSESESAKYHTKYHITDHTKMKKIRKNFNKLGERFSKSKIKELRKNFYEIENKNNFFASKIKNIDKNLFELEESPFEFSESFYFSFYYDYDSDE